jgi:transaldolase
LRTRAKAGKPLDEVISVASFFLSRIDTKVDGQLDKDAPLRGRVALASARVAYQRYLAKFAGRDWEHLRPWARSSSGRCGRAPGPRTLTTQTCSTSQS